MRQLSIGGRTKDRLKKKQGNLQANMRSDAIKNRFIFKNLNGYFKLRFSFCLHYFGQIYYYCNFYLIDL
jgi:hypothetical protein